MNPDYVQHFDGLADLDHEPLISGVRRRRGHADDTSTRAVEPAEPVMEAPRRVSSIGSLAKLFKGGEEAKQAKRDLKKKAKAFNSTVFESLAHMDLETTGPGAFVWGV